MLSDISENCREALGAPDQQRRKAHPSSQECERDYFDQTVANELDTDDESRIRPLKEKPTLEEQIVQKAQRELNFKRELEAYAAIHEPSSYVPSAWSRMSHAEKHQTLRGIWIVAGIILCIILSAVIPEKTPEQIEQSLDEVKQLRQENYDYKQERKRERDYIELRTRPIPSERDIRHYNQDSE